MKNYYICDITGKIVAKGFTNKEKVKNIKENEFIFYETIDDDSYHDFKSGKAKKRPTLLYDSFKKISKNENYILTDIPKNTNIKVNDIDYGIIDDGKLIISFPIEMVYKLELIPPFPYHKKNITIEVKNG